MSASTSTSNSSPAFDPLRLPNGSTLKNRIAKAAMEEMLSDVPNYNQPGSELIRLYKAWGEGGSALILTGHVMVDHRALAAPADVVLSRDSPHTDELKFREWIAAAQSNGSQMWLQINHPGRQVKKGMDQPTYAPSAVALNMGSKSISDMFPLPKALSEEEIQEIIDRFVWTARKAEEFGAAGVQIHAAHGYLASQFLSPNTNKREDQWGGSIQNRSRFLLEIARRIRGAVAPTFGVAVKINSADFQRGGFTEDESLWVVQQLTKLRLDFVELSGGSYEQPAMSGSAVDKDGNGDKRADSTKAREAYFLEFAQRIRPLVDIPLMVTGGVKRLQVLNEVASTGNTIVGVGTAIGLMPDLPNRWARGEDPVPTANTSWVLPGFIASVGKIVAVQYNMEQVAAGMETNNKVWLTWALAYAFWKESSHSKQYKKWMKEQQALTK